MLPIIFTAGITLFAASAAAASAPLLSGLPPSNATVYTVDLDADPLHRWDKVIEDHRAAIQKTSAFLKLAIPAKDIPVVEKVAALLDKAFPKYGVEMRGVAAAAQMPLGEIVLLNLLYSITVSCTSVVASAPDGTHIIHSRNLDYSLPDVLRPLAVEVHFVRGSTPVFSATIFAGAVGVLTGVAPGGVSLSVDERDAPGGAVWENLVELLVVEGARPVTFFVRDLLESGTTFYPALEATFLTPVIAPCYIIIGGLRGDEGAVVTRDRLTARDVWRLDSREADGWYRAETNWDHWVAPPAHDAERRAVINAAMRNMTRAGLSAPAFVAAMNEFPVLRSSTIYNAVMAAQTGEMVTYIRNSTRPYN